MKRILQRGIFRAAVASLVLWPVVPRAQQADPKFWVVDGNVRAFARDGNILYLGGNFTTIGPNTGAGAALDAASGFPMPLPYATILGSVWACTSDG